MVGALNTLLDLALFNALHYGLGLALVVANTLSYGAGIAQSFALNRHWTFADRRDAGRPVGRQLALFVALNLLALGLSNLTIWLLVRRFGLPAYAAKLVAVGVTFLWGYATSRRYVFRQR
ncbi:MAG: GtrA family protein [Proteobacteria bacterium]|nr:GtrA family protein [Pseudomonadota bacterium]